MPGLSFLSRVTEDEYRANLNGMNTFFGAVLGFALADVKTSSLADFAHLLLFAAAIVISILYVSASPQRWLYAGLTLIFIWFLPRVLDDATGEVGRLQVTLAVWAFMATFLEAMLAWQQRRDARRNAKPPA